MYVLLPNTLLGSKRLVFFESNDAGVVPAGIRPSNWRGQF
jgi:hypothetical protein